MTAEKDVANLRKVLPNAVAYIEAAERRATVDRIRERLTADGGFRFEARGEDVYAAETLFAILDEEASR